jgi:hypothetical protein
MILITPTGGRPHQIELCAKFMQNQDYKGSVTWVIIDDCEPRTTDFIKEDFRENWTIKKVYPKPIWQVGQNTQGRNICAGINEAKKYNPRIIFIIEDDDYYKSCYLRLMNDKITGYDLIGQNKTIYYNVTIKRWIENQNEAWSSLFQTAFTPAVIPIFEKLYLEKFIDFVLFRQVKRVNLFDGEKLSIGIKGQQGRAGIGAGHGWVKHMIPDPQSVKLKQLLGEDSKYYDGLGRCI